MRKPAVLLAAALLLAALLAAVPARAGGSGATCWVDPNPVPVHTTFTISGAGLGPSADYYAWVVQPSNDAPGSRPLFGSTTDAAGNFVIVLDADTAAYGHPLEPGSVHVKLAPASWEGNQLPTARCSFGVV